MVERFSLSIWLSTVVLVVLPAAAWAAPPEGPNERLTTRSSLKVRVENPVRPEQLVERQVKIVRSIWKQYFNDGAGGYRTLDGERVKQLGAHLVHREYLPQSDGATHITQTVTHLPVGLRRPRNATEAAKASLDYVVELAKHHHLRRNQLDEAALWEAAIGAVVAAFPDKYGYYESPTTIRDQTRAEVQGAELALWVDGERASQLPRRKRQGQIKVERIRRGSPAQRAKLKKGDVIQAVDGTVRYSPRDLEKAFAAVGQGDQLTLKVRRGKRALRVTVTKASFDDNPVDTRLRDGIGYARIREFDLSTRRRLDEAIAKLIKRNGDKELSGLVLDLRNNPGGELQNALWILDRFISSGPLLALRGFRGERASRVEARESITHYRDLPLVVLINHQSVSASELVAGVLQNRKRAEIVGETSEGKGTALTELPLFNGGVLGLIDRYYMLPNGETPHGVGIVPDVTRSQAMTWYLKRGGRVGADYALEYGFHKLASASKRSPGRTPAAP